MPEDIKRDTVGAYSSQLMKKDPDTRDPIELQREIHKTYEKNVFEALERGKKEYQSPFYLVVLTKKERLMQNVLRQYFFPQQSCPTPTWDQVVYRYTAHNDNLQYLWNVPDKETCQLFRQNVLNIAPEERDLLKMILDFSDGTLDKLARTYNGEIIV